MILYHICRIEKQTGREKKGHNDEGNRPIAVAVQTIFKHPEDSNRDLIKAICLQIKQMLCNAVHVFIFRTTFA